MEDFRTDNDFQIVDMEMLSLHCKQIDADAKAMGLPNLSDDFDTEMDRMIVWYRCYTNTHRYKGIRDGD